MTVICGTSKISPELESPERHHESGTEAPRQKAAIVAAAHWPKSAYAVKSWGIVRGR
jgi:hypothetical protein